LKSQGRGTSPGPTSFFKVCLAVGLSVLAGIVKCRPGAVQCLSRLKFSTPVRTHCARFDAQLPAPGRKLTAVAQVTACTIVTRQIALGRDCFRQLVDQIQKFLHRGFFPAPLLETIRSRAKARFDLGQFRNTNVIESGSILIESLNL